MRSSLRLSAAGQSTLRLNLFLQGVNVLHHIGLAGNLLQLLGLGTLDLPGAELGLQSLDITQFLLEVSQLFGRIRGYWLLAAPAPARGPCLVCDGSGGELRREL